MPQHSDTTTPRRPRMAMLVGNQVVGDSRVEKAAVSAARAGYDVTVVGVSHRTTTNLGRYQDIPILRVPLPLQRYRAWLTLNDPDRMEGIDWGRTVPAEELARIEEKADTSDASPGWAQAIVRGSTPHSAPDALRGRVSRAARAVDARLTGRKAPLPPRAQAGLQRAARAAANLQAGRTEGWRRTWPMIADYEDAFLRALIELDPDIIHAHDRHPLPAAAAYARYRAAMGLPHVPWVYDAHEWIPGQAMLGPVEQRIGWKAAEAELIHHADAVFAVTDELAGRMRDYHGLTTTPTTVANAPWAVRAPMDPAVRRPLREECGLSPETPLLVYVGRVAEVRGVLTAVDALRHLPEVHVAFVASPGEVQRQFIRDRAEAVGVADRVHIVDYVPSASVTWYISSADVGLSPLLPTPAHESAVPTKLRECLLAGLPLVVSDLREQAKFVRDQGVGETHTPGDELDLARAVRAVLEDLPRLRAAVAAPEVQDPHRWEASEQGLHQVWGGLLPADPATDRAGGRVADRVAVSFEEPTAERLVVIGSTPAASTLADAWASGGGDAVVRSPRLPPEDPARLVGSPVELSSALAEWLDDDLRASAVVYDGTGPAAGRAEGSMAKEVRSLAGRGRSVGVLAGDTPLADPAVRCRVVPRHTWRELDEASSARLIRQTRRASQPVLEAVAAGAPLLTHSRIDAVLVPGTVWVPRVHAVAEKAPDLENGLGSVLVVPAARTLAEQAAIAEVTTWLEQQGVDVQAPSRARFDRRGQDAWAADVVLDGLFLGEPSPAAERAWARGAVVVGGPLAFAEEHGHDVPPVIQASPETLRPVLDGLLNGSGAEREARSVAALRYAREVHSAEAVSRRLKAALGLAPTA